MVEINNFSFNRIWSSSSINYSNSNIETTKINLNKTNTHTHTHFEVSKVNPFGNFQLTHSQEKLFWNKKNPNFKCKSSYQTCISKKYSEKQWNQGEKDFAKDKIMFFSAKFLLDSQNKWKLKTNRFHSKFSVKQM